MSGDLVDELGPIDVLRATLPAGTVSGRPKVRAMEIIDELEPVKRGPVRRRRRLRRLRGNLDTAIAIRTMFVHDGAASVQAGAGIVADSDPDDEDLECRNKAAALLAAVPAARRMTRRREAGTPANPRRCAVRRPRSRNRMKPRAGAEHASRRGRWRGAGAGLISITEVSLQPTRAVP